MGEKAEFFKNNKKEQQAVRKRAELPANLLG